MLWKTISPYFVNNPKKKSKITLLDEEGNTSSEDEKTAETLDKLFGNIIKNLSISINSQVFKEVSLIKLIKENIELFSSVLSRMFNFYIDKASFPKQLQTGKQNSRS